MGAVPAHTFVASLLTKNALYATKTATFRNAIPQNLSGVAPVVVVRCTNLALILGEISLEIRSHAQFAVDLGRRSAIVQVA